MIKHKHYADALSCFEQVVEFDANHAEAWYRIGCCRSELLKQKIENSEEVLGVHEESEIYESAIQAYLKAIELRPDLADARGSVAELFYDYFDLQGSAVEAYQNAIELQPDHADACKFIADLFYVYAERQVDKSSEEVSSYERAIDWSKQAGEICPEIIEECYQQMVWICTCWMDEAIYETQLDDVLAPSDICMRIDEVGDAVIEAHHKLTQIRPNDSNAYYKLGNAHWRWSDVFIRTSQFVSETLGGFETDEIEAMKQGKDPYIREIMEKAIKAYRTAVKIKPDYADAYNELAKSCRWIGQFEQAIQAFKHAIVLGNNEHYNLARTYHKLGKKHFDDAKYTDAIECYHNAVVTDSKYDEVYYDLAVANDEVGNYELAILWYQRAKSSHGNPDLQYRLAKACHRIGCYQDAIEAYERAIDCQRAIEEEYNQKSYYERYDSEPPAGREWWTEVNQNLEFASRHEPLQPL